MAEPAVLLFFTNCPDRERAEQIARTLVDERLAACATLLGPATSVYRWQGATHTDTEWPLMLKTSADNGPALQARLFDLHPYELPEIVAVPVTAGLPGYLQWVRDETRC